MTEMFIGEKEKWTNTWNDKQKEADSLLHNKTSLPNICTKFQNPRCSRSWEIFDDKKLEKEKWRNKGTNKQQ